MSIVRCLTKLLTIVLLSASLSFGSAIVSGFDSTSDGRNDDGTYTTGGCNNAYPGGTCTGTPVPIGFDVDYFGQIFDTVYINTNGNVTFDAPLPYVSGLLQSSLLDAYDDIVAPFLADVDTRNPNSGVVTFGDGTFDGYPAFGVNWINVGYFDDEANKLDSFQLLLVDEGSGDFEIVFNYGNIEWETGDADYGTDGLGGYSAIVGFTDGSGNPANTFELPGSSVPGSFINGGPNALISNSLNSDVPGRYIFDFVDGVPVVTPEPKTLGLLLIALVVLIYRHASRQLDGSVK
jgi:Nidogen-like